MVKYIRLRNRLNNTKFYKKLLLKSEIIATICFVVGKGDHILPAEPQK